MFAGTDHLTKFDVTRIHVYLYVFLSLSLYHIPKSYLFRINTQTGYTILHLYILCLRMIRVPLEASAAVSGCHRDMSHTLDPVLDKRYAWKGNKTATAKED